MIASGDSIEKVVSRKKHMKQTLNFVVDDFFFIL